MAGSADEYRAAGGRAVASFFEFQQEVREETEGGWGENG